MNRNRTAMWLLTYVSLVLACSIAVMGFACNWELDVYRTLAEAQVGYDTYWRTIVTLHEQHVGSEQYYAQAEAIATRLYNVGKSTTALMVEYKKLGDPAVKAKIDAAVRDLLTLVASLVQLAEGLGVKPSGGTVSPTAMAQFEERTSPKLQRIDADLGEIESLRETEATR